MKRRTGEELKVKYRLHVLDPVAPTVATTFKD